MDGSLEPAAALLERAVGYALGAVHHVTPRLAGRPTPCADWDLDSLLRHTCDSLSALREGIDAGYVGVPGIVADPPCGADPVAAFRVRAVRLLGAWAAATGSADRRVTIADLPLAAAAVAEAGALEIAVHGWDIARAAGAEHPLPPALSSELLRTAYDLVPSPETRPPLFAPPRPVPPNAPAPAQLLSFLGRNPNWPPAT